MRCLGLLLIVAACAGWLGTARAASPPAEPGPAAAAHAAEGHEGQAPSPLEWKADLALWTAVVFLLVLGVLWRFAWGPIASGLATRERAIAEQIAGAERNNQEAQRLLAAHQQKLDQAQEEVRGLLEQARRDAEAAGRELIDKARAEARHEQEKGVRQIEQASAAALKELAEHSSRLAVLLAGRIVGQQLKAPDHAALIQRTLAEFSAASGPDRNAPRN